ncbi:unnamed protein product [Chondrus crispus]|uniref:Uncharacterized protein n=1 Tax=Chondrus crispus TaxID=2769 RepID=R7QII8_CHOCR|nr:unnamed protein product [Chondrus crispus]CDF37553.1 unnamed protein product [Chondrus crispus]|eukprot:XP_005717424.1 unnamed protein product [Chondrus crispus]
MPQDYHTKGTDPAHLPHKTLCRTTRFTTSPFPDILNCTHPDSLLNTVLLIPLYLYPTSSITLSSLPSPTPGPPTPSCRPYRSPCRTSPPTSSVTSSPSCTLPTSTISISPFPTVPPSATTRATPSSGFPSTVATFSAPPRARPHSFVSPARAPLIGKQLTPRPRDGKGLSLYRSVTLGAFRKHIQQTKTLNPVTHPLPKLSAQGLLGLSD